jgi:uncharacterized C2H2 Zn-finger protein
MKIIQDSGKDHWAIGTRITCPQCETIFAAETKGDFQVGAVMDYILLTCPRCGHGFRHHHASWHNAHTPVVRVTNHGTTTDLDKVLDEHNVRRRGGTA